MPFSNSNLLKILIMAAIAIFMVVSMFVLPSSGDTCGDYDRADAEDMLLEDSRIEEGNDGHSYEYEEGDGDYRKKGAGEFEYVGCSDGSHSSGGSHSTSGGSAFRGGGPGSGK